MREVDRDAPDALATLAAMKSVMIYDPETGQFIRTITINHVARAGDVAGSINASSGYRHIRVGRRMFRANRLAWLWMTGGWPNGRIDHANGNCCDDRWCNLREASSTENAANAKKRADNTSGCKGVRAFRGKWQARIGSGGKVHLGTFGSKEEAAEAYAAAAKKIYGEFARTA